MVATALMALPHLSPPIVGHAAAPVPAFVQGAATTTSTNLAFPKAVGRGDLLVAGLTTNDSGTDQVTGVSDSLNGSWTRLTSVRYGNGHVDVYYLGNSAAGADTVTIAGAHAALSIAEYSGVLASGSPVDQYATKSGSANPNTGPTAAIGAANELVLGIGGMSAPGAFSAGTGFTMRGPAVSNFLYSVGLEDQLSASTAGQSMTMKSTNTGYYGAVVAVFKAVTPAAGPTAALVLSPNAGAAPLVVTADASGSIAGASAIASYTFNFGDGSSLLGPQASATSPHTYGSGGRYTVTVTVSDSAGATSNAAAAVTVGAPTAALRVTPTSGPSPLAVAADASLSSDPVGIISYTFDFGDGSAVLGPQAGSKANHTYGAAGGYTAKVTVTDGVGVTATATSAVLVWTPPTASLSVSPSSGAALLVVTADSSASAPGTNPIASYTFSFGDGSAAVGPQAGASASHSYTNGGIFTVMLTVADSAGATSTATATVVVAAPQAALKLAPALGLPPLAVTADASGSSDPIGISTYTFNFGDGSPVVGPQPGSKASHTYSTTGSYTAEVTVTDAVGANATTTSPVIVTQAAPPSAALAVTPSSGGAPLAVTADASGSTSGTNSIAGYTFDFGDGSTAGPTATPIVGHLFSSTGTFTVTLTVTDTAGVSATASATVTVVAPPAASVSVTPSSGSAPLSVTADASGSRDPLGITGYTFDFGDGSAAIGPQTASAATHTYVSGGTFTVTVTVTDRAGAATTANASVSVVVPPTAVLTVTPTSGTAPLQVSASGAGSIAGSRPIAGFTFNFGNGSVVGPQAAATANGTYANPGTYTVTMTVTDTGGVSATAATTVSANSLIIVQDTFRRANQGGWGTASGGATWAAGSGLSISANEGVISNSGTSQFETLAPAIAADGSGLVRFSIAAGNDTAGIILRWTDSNNRWLGRFDGAGNLQILARSGGTENVLGRTPVTVATGRWYWLRFQVQGQSAGIRLWPDGSAEPSTWNLSVNSALTPAAGRMGLYGWAAVGAPVLFDTFSVAAFASSGQVANSIITGTVTDTNGHGPIAGVQATTIPATATTTTNALGVYSLSVPAGSYTVVFTGASSGYNANYVSSVQAPTNGSVTAGQQLQAIPPQVAMDTFTQPDQTGGWSPSTDGHVWASDLGSYPGAQAGITGSQAWVDTSSSTATDYDDWMGYQYQDQEVTGDVDITTVVSDPTFQHGGRLLARVQNSTTFIVLTLDPPNGSNPSYPNGDVALWVAVNNSWSELAIVPKALATNTWYHAKLDVLGNLVMGKVWVDGSAEPGWLVSATQTALPGAGQAGTRTTGAHVNWANFMQKPITQIAGVITDSTGGPIANATVRLGTGASAVTDGGGNYAFAGLLGGTAYAVTASAAGYVAASIAVTPVAGKTVTGSIGLSTASSSGVGAGGGLTVSTQIQNGITNNPNNGQVETDLTWTDASGNGWRVGAIPNYGGANIATWYEVDNGVVGPTQSSLNTTNPTDLIHDFTQSSSGAYWGSESTPYAQTSLGGSAFRVGYQAKVPAVGVDPNGFSHTVTTYVYPGDPGFMVNRFDITNPSSAPIQLAGTESVEFDVISGLEGADATWRLANGGYGYLGSAPVQGWPASPTPGNPDYFYITPATGSGVSDGILAVPATKLTTLGLLNVQLLGESNSHRVKVLVYGNNALFPAATTMTFYLLQAISRNLTPAEAQSIAADYLNPDSPAMGVGASNGFSYDGGLYSFTASNNVVTFTPGFSSTVQERWLDIYKVTNYTAANLSGVTLNGVVLTATVDYVSYVDQANHVAYVKLLKPLVPGSPAAGQLRAGPITIG